VPLIEYDVTVIAAFPEATAVANLPLLLIIVAMLGGRIAKLVGTAAIRREPRSKRCC
jgi:hypothetical protein